MAVIGADSDGVVVIQEDITNNVYCFRRAEKQGPEQGVLKQCFGTQPLC